MTKAYKRVLIACFVFSLWVMSCSDLHAIDSELTRQTIVGIKSVSVAVENPQPNIQKYAPRFGLTREQLQKDVDEMLAKSGIAVLAQDKWLKTPGKPLLYISINTHEYEKYWYAYSVRVELRQLATLDANPGTKTLAATWGTEMTGVANIGTLGSIKNNVRALVQRFIDVYRTANRIESKLTKQDPEKHPN